ncbi:MAG: hypothetical protein AAF657_12980 [Acidobacteriota bacterium]
MKNRTNIWILCAISLLTPAAQADWLVTKAGERIETQGSWEVRGRAVVFTNSNGILSSLRLSEIDLEASNAATETAGTAAQAPTRSTAPRQSVRVITTEDIGEGQPGAEGPDRLIERLRLAHQYQDTDLALGLINWQDVPESMRPSIESQFEWMMERRIRNLRFVPADPDDQALLQVQDDVTYEPNVEVAGKIEIEFIPDPDEAEVRLSFPVGTRLGSYFIAAPRAADE